jgi:zinc finger-like protein
VLNQLGNGCLSTSNEEFPWGSQIEGLQLLLQYNAQNATTLCKFLEKLSTELESFVLGVRKQFAFQELEVNCS